MVRKGEAPEALDRLFVSALIECRSCERFGVLADAAAGVDSELEVFYRSLFGSEFGHYTVFLKLAGAIAPLEAVEARWQYFLDSEARILAAQAPGPRIHSGMG
jgi:tRNA-(ms[2]io[6]A)-hydroxylase